MFSKKQTLFSLIIFAAFLFSMHTGAYAYPRCSSGDPATTYYTDYACSGSDNNHYCTELPPRGSTAPCVDFGSGTCLTCKPMGQTCVVYDDGTGCEIEQKTNPGSGVCPGTSNPVFCGSGSGGGGGGGACSIDSDCGSCHQCCGSGSSKYCSNRNYNCAGTRICGTGGGYTPTPYPTKAPTPTPNPNYITGTLYADYNDDGAANNGDPGIGGVTIYASASNGDSITTITASDGSFTLKDLTPASYTVQVLEHNVPSTFEHSATHNSWFASGDASKKANVKLFLLPLFISGTVYKDLNNDGKVDDIGDVPITNASLKVCAFATNENPCVSVDSKGGFYIPNLHKRAYTVEVSMTDAVKTIYRSNSHFYTYATPRKTIPLFLSPKPQVSGFVLADPDNTCGYSPTFNSRYQYNGNFHINITNTRGDSVFNTDDTPHSGKYASYLSTPLDSGTYNVTISGLDTGYRVSTTCGATSTTGGTTATRSITFKDGNIGGISFWILPARSISGYVLVAQPNSPTPCGPVSKNSVYMPDQPGGKSFTITFTSPTGNTYTLKDGKGTGNGKYWPGGYTWGDSNKNLQAGYHIDTLPSGTDDTYAITLTDLPVGYTVATKCTAATRSIHIGKTGGAGDAGFWVNPPTISGKLCIRETGDCSDDNSDTPYLKQASVKVYKFTGANSLKPCDFPHEGTCTFDTLTFQPDPTTGLSLFEGVNAYGQAWSWDMNGDGARSSIAGDDRWGTGSVNRPCYYERLNCKLDTRTYFRSSSTSMLEAVTKGNDWYTFNPLVDEKDSKFFFDGGSLYFARWKQTNGPCDGYPACTFDTRTYQPDILGVSGAETITGKAKDGNNKYWSFSGDTFLGGNQAIESVTRWKGFDDRPCWDKNTPTHIKINCKLDTHDYKVVNDGGKKVIEVITAYGKLIELNTDGTIYSDPQFTPGHGALPLDPLTPTDPLLRDGVIKRYSSMPQKLSITAPSIYNAYTASLGSTGYYFASISNIDPNYHITFAKNEKGTDPTDNVCSNPKNGDMYASCCAKDTSGNPVSCRVLINVGIDAPTQNFALWPKEPHSIEGTVFIDDGKDKGKQENGRKEGGEIGLPQSFDVLVVNEAGETVAHPTIPSSANGFYKIDGLVPGKYTVTYSAISGNRFTHPEAKYMITLGTGCSSNPTLPDLDATCDGKKNVIDANIGVVATNNWFQVVCGDIRSGNAFEDLIPSTKACQAAPNPKSNFYAIDSNASICQTNPMGPGIVISGKDASFGLGEAALYPQKGSVLTPWIVKNQPFTSSYLAISFDFITSYIKKTNTKETILASSPITLDTMTPGIYKTTGDLVVNASTAPSGNFIFLVDGKLTIMGKISVPTTSTLTFLTSGTNDIVIDASVGETDTTSTASDIDGFYSAGGNFVIDGIHDCNVTTTKDLRLNIAGAVITKKGTILNNRDLCDNFCNPTYTVTQRIDFLLHAPAILRYTNTVWQEVAP